MLPNPTQDGTAILWRECLAHESVTSPDKAAGPKTPAAIAAPKVSSEHGGQLVPAAIMRGHSGTHVWRLAVHEFDPCSIDHEGRSSGSCGAPKDGGAIAEGSPGRGLVLMATGGNDGAAKLWDLDFEAACETGNVRKSRWEALTGSPRCVEAHWLRLHRICLRLHSIQGSALRDIWRACKIVNSTPCDADAVLATKNQSSIQLLLANFRISGCC